MCSADADERARSPVVVCTGMAVLDEVFRVDRFPIADRKTLASDFLAVAGGCAANAAIAIARLGGRAVLASPLGGPRAQDVIGDTILGALTAEQVVCDYSVRLSGARSTISTICIDARGERTIVSYRDHRLAGARIADPEGLAAMADVVLADNWFPEFVLPVCRAARARGCPVVLDADRADRAGDACLEAASHVIFSAEALRAAAGFDDLTAALQHVHARYQAFLAVTDGPNDLLFMDGPKVCRLPVFSVSAVDTLAAGDVFDGSFALRLAEGGPVVDALRFAAAAAAIKCTRFGGISGAPLRPDVERLLAA